MNISMASNESLNITACNDTRIVNGDGKPVTSIIMFLAAVVGNLLALFILGVHQKEHRSKSSVFCILVTGLALTDLLGTCLLSPPVFICYASKMSLISLGGAGLCNLLGFAMSFFGLAPTLILCAMAVERCLAISHPYFYSVHIRHSFAKFTLFFIYLFSLAFCLLPYTGYGKFRQYCPGTWCFIDMDATGNEKASLVLAFSLSYSSLMALLIFAVLVCNGSVIVSLCQMHRSQMMRRGSVGSAGRRRRMSLAWFVQGEEEVDYLVLLALITVIFVICSLPLTIAGFINAIHPFCGDKANLLAFRFNAFNPIVDPWVFIICRKSVFRHLGSLLSCRFSKTAVKTSAHCALSLPLDNHIQRNPPDVTDPQTNIYSGLPL
ncbi:hypothetical protein PBY51_009667 [Eleginops maclovinus]|uniref:Thromboxane A2 receptor n=1 Tax=Eleginops maclovinus TaxID=56733 RepID=A0AAN8AV94_ELEMC|nr:hypothetical protein PBY51_009667 [Eleginops maclovinus]